MGVLMDTLMDYYGHILSKVIICLFFARHSVSDTRYKSMFLRLFLHHISAAVKIRSIFRTGRSKICVKIRRHRQHENKLYELIQICDV